MRARIGAAATVIDKAPKSTTEPFQFLDLPREIRDQVYNECMCVEKAFPRPRPF